MNRTYKPGTQYTQTQYVIASKQQRDMISQPPPSKQYMTSKDYDHIEQRIKRYMWTGKDKSYNSYSRRGKGNRWAHVNSRLSGTLINGGLIIDISKLLALGGYGTKKHASTMHKIAHKIKVNALKPALITDDKYITYGN